MKNKIKGFCQPVAKHEEEEISKYFDKDLHQVVLSVKQKKKRSRTHEKFVYIK